MTERTPLLEAYDHDIAQLRGMLIHDVIILTLAIVGGVALAIVNITTLFVLVPVLAVFGQRVWRRADFYDYLVDSKKKEVEYLEAQAKD